MPPSSDLSPLISRLADEVVAPESYEAVRSLYLTRMIEHRRRRRLRLGVNAVVLFEDRETVLAQLHEQLRAGGPWTRSRIRREAAELAPLAPAQGELTATLMIDGGPAADGRRLGACLRSGAASLRLEAGARYAAGRPADELDDDLGCPVHYLRFQVERPLLEALADASSAVTLTLVDEGGPIREALRDETCAQLVADLSAGPAPSLLATLVHALPALSRTRASAPGASRTFRSARW